MNDKLKEALGKVANIYGKLYSFATFNSTPATQPGRVAQIILWPILYPTVVITFVIFILIAAILTCFIGLPFAGAEEYGLPKEVLEKCHQIVQIPGSYCLNVATAASIVMYDRINKGR